MGSGEEPGRDHATMGGSRPKNRLTTGIPRLDFILKGGFLRGGMYSLIGPPGAGKTILANQICFHHLRHDDGMCVYLTLLIESHAKMMHHLSSLEFFDLEQVGSRIYYVSGYQALRKEGLKGLLDLIRRTLRERKASFLAVDGLESAAEMAEDRQSFKEFLHQLQIYTEMIGCTTLLSSIADDSRKHLEGSIVDGILELSDHLIGPRAVRELTVHKFRGSDYLRGRHEVEISGRGLVVHPRTEIHFDRPPGQAVEERLRMPFGIPRLDEMLYGGPLSGSTTALLGAPGTGKTLMGLAFLIHGAMQGQSGTYFGFYEPPPRLCEKAAQIGLDLEKYMREGLIEVVWQPPLEHMMDALAEQLLEKIRREPRERRRLFVDGLEGFRAAAVYRDRMPRFLSALTNQLRMADVTTLFSEELSLFHPEVNMPSPELANVVESVILLRYVELHSQLYRLISIMKMRESRYDTSIREFRITDRGVDVAESFASAEAILTGHARQVEAAGVTP